MDKLYAVSIYTYFETELLHREELDDFSDDVSYKSYEYFYNFKNRIGFGDRPYCVDSLRNWWRGYDPSTVIIEQRVFILGHCKECAIEQVETWFKEHREMMGEPYGVCDARLLKKKVA